MTVLEVFEKAKEQQKKNKRNHWRYAATDKEKQIIVGGVALLATVGTVAGALLAPKSGKETREELAQAAKEAVEKAKEKLEEVKEKAAEVDEEVKRKLKEKMSIATVDGWLTIISWQGRSTKDTESFQVQSSEWRLRWITHSVSEGETGFKIIVRDEQNAIVSEVANIKGYDEDSSYVKQSGKFYLQIVSGQPYCVVAEQRMT